LQISDSYLAKPEVIEIWDELANFTGKCSIML